MFIALIGMVSRVSNVARRSLVCEMFYKFLKTNTAVISCLDEDHVHRYKGRAT